MIYLSDFENLTILILIGNLKVICDYIYFIIIMMWRDVIYEHRMVQLNTHHTGHKIVVIKLYITSCHEKANAKQNNTIGHKIYSKKTHLNAAQVFQYKMASTIN